MADNLFFSRDTRVIVSDGTGVWEIPVLDGFSFSQATNTSEITLNEMESTAGVSRRGRRVFNDSYAPAEWSFSTYARPVIATAGSGTVWENTGCDAQHHAVEEVLWAALVGNAAFTASNGTNEATWADNITNTTSAMTIDMLGSNKSALKTLTMYFVMGQGGFNTGTHKIYKLAGAVVNTAGIDFDLDGITTINWSGFAQLITDATAAGLPTVTIDEDITSTDNFIRNRLTTLAITATAQAPIVGTYALTLTGGSINFENNITFLTPETLGVVNQPLGHVTGTRNFGGSFTCYLSNTSTASADLWEDLIEATTSITNDFNLVFNIGGSSAPKMSITMPTCHLEIPTHSIEDVISLEANFHAIPSAIGAADEATIVYTGS